MRQRALGAFYGLAIGDALGMPTQLLPRAVVVRRYGPMLTGFEAGPSDHPVAAGLPAGSVTDDSEQAILVAHLLIEGMGHIEGAELARRLVDWEGRMRARGSLELLGPSTRRAIDELLGGAEPSETGRFGATNGAAMRIAPVGIATPAADPESLLERVLEASTVTHNTGTALAAAAAVAAAISAGIEGAGVAGAIEAATKAATSAGELGHFVAGADVSSRLKWAVGLVEGRPLSEVADLVYRLVGTGVAAQESVPAAFAVLKAAGSDPFLAGRLAASLGGDCDTIAAIAASMAGACHGVAAFPAGSRRLVEEVNGLRLEPLVDDLLQLRRLAADEAGARGPAAVPPAGPVLVHAGNAVADLVLRVPRLPARGGDVLASAAEWAAGGGVNVMVAARRRGVAVRYAGAHGCGPFGDLVRLALDAGGIEVVGAPRPDADTGFVVTLVEPAGERTFVTRTGAEGTLRAADLAGLGLRPSDGLYLSGYGLVHRANGWALGDLVESLHAGVLVVLDPGPLVADLPADVLEKVFARTDWVSCNAEEARVLTGAADPGEASHRLAARLARGGAVVRAGAAGCHVCPPGSSPVHVAGFPVDALDTTGAGDAHVGTFAAELLNGAPVLRAARVANGAAALAVLREGPATSPSATELDAFVAAHSPDS